MQVLKFLLHQMNEDLYIWIWNTLPLIALDHINNVDSSGIGIEIPKTVINIYWHGTSVCCEWMRYRKLQHLPNHRQTHTKNNRWERLRSHLIVDLFYQIHAMRNINSMVSLTLMLLHCCTFTLYQERLGKKAGEQSNSPLTKHPM